jgi:hypothetical protein
VDGRLDLGMFVLRHPALLKAVEAAHPGQQIPLRE